MDTGSSGSLGHPGGLQATPVDALAPQPVVSWYRRSARDLPWRRPGTTPWAVLVSEVMSQQTPVSRVVPVWEEWLRRWPGPEELAGAPASEVLRVWDRLGYPRRALRLQECARAVMEQHGGVLPRDRQELLRLPGVGEYTAGAVVAFAYGRRALVLDTNVRRVLARAVGGQALPPPTLTRAERQRAETLLPPGDSEAATWSVAVMELGALVCTARDPGCAACPWADSCAWVAAGRPADRHASRRRTQAWRGTDRQARGLVMAVLRETDGPVDSGVLRDAASRAWQDGRAAAERRSRGRGELDASCNRVLASLMADGLVVTQDGGATFSLP